MNTRSPNAVPLTMRWAVLAVIVAAAMIRCGEDNGGPNPSDAVDGADLFGLADARTLVYLRTDTVRDSAFELHVYEALDTIVIRGNGDDWTVTGHGQPMLSLKVTGDFILQNGYWPVGTAASADLIYFAVPPVLMPRRLQADQVWEGHYPFYRDGDTEYQRLFLYSYFGFYFTRSFTGNAALTLPAGSFTSLAFEVRLFQDDTDVHPLATVREYYVPAVGLVRLSFEAGAFKRVLNLVDYD